MKRVRMSGRSIRRPIATRCPPGRYRRPRKSLRWNTLSRSGRSIFREYRERTAAFHATWGLKMFGCWISLFPTGPTAEPCWQRTRRSGSVARCAMGVSANRSTGRNPAAPDNRICCMSRLCPCRASNHPADDATLRCSTPPEPAYRVSSGENRYSGGRVALAAIGCAVKVVPSGPISRPRVPGTCAHLISPASPVRRRLRTGCAATFWIREEYRRDPVCRRLPCRTRISNH